MLKYINANDEQTEAREEFIKNPEALVAIKNNIRYILYELEQTLKQLPITLSIDILYQNHQTFTIYGGKIKENHIKRTLVND